LTFGLKYDKIIKNEKNKKALFYAGLEGVVFLTGSTPSAPFKNTTKRAKKVCQTAHFLVLSKGYSEKCFISIYVNIWI